MDPSPILKWGNGSKFNLEICRRNVFKSLSKKNNATNLKTSFDPVDCQN